LSRAASEVPDVGFGGGLHTKQAGKDRTESATQESDAGAPAKGRGQQHQHKNHNHENGQYLVLTLEEGHGASMDRISDLLHLLITGWL